MAGDFYESPADRQEMVESVGVLCTFALGQDDWDAYAIVERNYVDVQGVQGYRPTLLCRTEDLYAPGELLNDENRATSVNTPNHGGFDIIEFQHDGTGGTSVSPGMTLCVLEAPE